MVNTNTVANLTNETIITQENVHTITLRSVSESEVWTEQFRTEARNRLITDNENYGRLPVLTSVQNNNAEVIDVSLVESFNQDSNVLNTRLSILENIANGHQIDGIAHTLINYASNDLVRSMTQAMQANTASLDYSTVINVVNYAVFGLDDTSEGLQAIYAALNHRISPSAVLEESGVDLNAIRREMDNLDHMDVTEADSERDNHNRNRNQLASISWFTMIRRGTALLGGIAGTYFGAPFITPALRWVGGAIGRSIMSDNPVPTELTRFRSESSRSLSSDDPSWTDVSAATGEAWKLFFNWLGSFGGGN